MSRSRGQALVETLVVAIVAVPLLLLVVVLGKYANVRQSTIAASRTLAFECSVRLDECRDFSAHAQMVDELRRRHFSRGEAPIVTGDTVSSVPVASTRPALWVDAANRSLLASYEDIGARVEPLRFDAGQSVAISQSRAIANAASVLSTLAGPGRFGLAITEGLFDARVQVNLGRLHGASDFSAQLQQLALRMTARTALLADSWNASGSLGAEPTSVASRVARGQLLPGGADTALDIAYLPVRGFLGLMGFVGLEPAADAFRYHEADVTRLPADRLAP